MALKTYNLRLGTEHCSVRPWQESNGRDSPSSSIWVMMGGCRREAMKGVDRLLVGVLRSHPAWMSCRVIGTLLLNTAVNTGVTPQWSREFRSAPASISVLTIPTWPRSTALWSGVLCSSFSVLTGSIWNNQSKVTGSIKPTIKEILQNSAILKSPESYWQWLMPSFSAGIWNKVHNVKHNLLTTLGQWSRCRTKRCVMSQWACDAQLVPGSCAGWVFVLWWCSSCLPLGGALFSRSPSLRPRLLRRRAAGLAPHGTVGWTTDPSHPGSEQLSHSSSPLIIQSWQQ